MSLLVFLIIQYLYYLKMLHHTLICQLDDSKIKFRTTRISSNPNKDQIYLHNINTIQKILDYCHTLMMYIKSILASYEGEKSTPTFHISSPKHGWTDNFKDNCKHADYIDVENDYPLVLHKFAETIDICLDVEAKAKNNAIHALYTQLF